MDIKELQQSIRPFATPDHKKSIVQLLNSSLPYIALWGAMIAAFAWGLPYWVVLLLIVPTAFFQVRLFIIFHDCCHQSFFRSRRTNEIVGTILGILTFTPYASWGREHLDHHATVANLDKRGTGDVWTMTVQEYRGASTAKRLAYRLVRNPFVMFGLGPIWVFLLFHRLFPKGASAKEKRGVMLTNLALAVMVVGMGLLIGWKAYLLIQLPLIYISGMMGIWLFYVQHQFDPTHWAPQKDWDFMRASLDGSSYYKLPKILQWLTGNIGLHHVHHINARIPNYNLQACLDSTPILNQVEPVTF
jgi:omega-6 fatty acid desaturase (delta-12 desaturase)